MKTGKLKLLLWSIALIPLFHIGAANTPNIVVILADDLGYADLGCQGSKEVPTPNIDSLARNGVRCTAGYVSAPQCCPSRAGLITGRYQNRFGFEYNFSVEPNVGLPLQERTIADYLKATGYVTGMIGKWHLGPSEDRRPYHRGFMETLWNPNGGILFPDKKTGFLANVFRNQEPAQISEYSTDAFAKEAAEFIVRHQQQPFFLYLAFVPPHWPMEAKPDKMERFKHVADLHRRTYLGMMSSLDDGVGIVLEALRKNGLEEKTLVFFLSDNGGPTGSPRPNPEAPFQYGQNTSLNAPCRGVKGDLLEGGIRIPFLVQWKGRLPAGKLYDQPVISLDILPTALAVAGCEVRAEMKLDGVNLLPYLEGSKTGTPHETLLWRFNFPPSQPDRYRWAIRQGDWKLVKNDVEPISLYNLAEDISESNNLSAKFPEKVAALESAWKNWNRELLPPAWSGAPAKAGTKSAKKSQAPSTSATVVSGWMARGCKLSVQKGSLRMEGSNDSPYMANAGLSATGPVKFQLRLRSPSGGVGKLQWRLDGQADFINSQITEFTVTAGDWQEITVPVPLKTTDKLIHVRIYLPADKQAVEVDSIQVFVESQETTPVKVWTFDN